MSELFDRAGLDQTRYLVGGRDARRLLGAGSMAHGYIPVPTPRTPSTTSCIEISRKALRAAL